MAAGPAELEMVAMVLGSMPVPPMPMLAGEEVKDEITVMSGEHRVANSHDLWAMLLVTAMQRNNQEENKARAVAQKESLTQLFVDVQEIDEKKANMHSTALERAVYDVFCKFTRTNLGLLATSQDIRFMPLESVKREDRVHVATCHHAGAQDIIFGPLRSDGEGQAKRCAEEFSEFPYTSLMMRQFARMNESAHVAEEGVCKVVEVAEDADGSQPAPVEV